MICKACTGAAEAEKVTAKPKGHDPAICANGRGTTSWCDCQHRAPVVEPEPARGPGTGE